MSKVLVINSSITPLEKSYSWALAKIFLDYYQKQNPQDEIIHLNLNQTPMAQISLTEKNFSHFFNAQDSDYYIKQLKDVDKVVFISPMYNFAVSSLLKNFLDHVLVADKTFSYKYAKKKGSVGLLKHLKIQVIASQGAPKTWYPFGNHVAYLEGAAKFVGAKVNRPSLLLAGTKAAPLNKLTPSEAAKTMDQQIQKAASTF